MVRIRFLLIQESVSEKAMWCSWPPITLEGLSLYTVVKESSVTEQELLSDLNYYFTYLNEAMTDNGIFDPNDMELIFKAMLHPHYFFNFVYFITRKTSYTEKVFNGIC